METLTTVTLTATAIGGAVGLVKLWGLFFRSRTAVGLDTLKSKVESAPTRLEFDALKAEVESTREAVCAIQTAHERCSTARAGEGRELTKLEGRIDLLVQEVRLGMASISERSAAAAEDHSRRLADFQSQTLRDLAAVSDTVHLRLRRELDPLIMAAAAAQAMQAGKGRQS